MEVINHQGLLSSDIPAQKGQLLYESEVAFQKESQPLPVAIYEKCIIINAKDVIKYRFDIKFGVEFNSIQFEYLDEVIRFVLVRSDQNQWKTILKKFLNQKGFHQQFKPIKKIGKGNFASVYLAQQIQTNLKCAVKAFSKEAAFSQQNGKECLIKQIQIMRHLNHKNNMKLYEVYESDNSLYIVFELLEGGQLYDKIKAKHKFTTQQVKKITHGLLEGLREMHSKNIMHRDLKPQNILFRSQGDYDCVIADYGLAEFANQQNYLFVRCGTPGYVAPQVINIKDMKTKYSPVCDIFSLGLIFHVLLMGKSVFRGSTYNQILTQNRVCDFIIDGPEYETIGPQSLDLLKKMLRTNPEERITAQQAIDHPYFKQLTENEDLAETNQEKMDQLTKLIDIVHIKNNQNPHVNEDSCISFKIGKQNAFTGTTDTQGNMNSAKLSFGGNILNGITQKSSKFTTTPKPTVL